QPTAPRGIAVTGIDDSNGVWQYSTDSGATWNDFRVPTAPSVTTALVLENVPNNRIRFVPRLNYNSNVGLPTFQFRAWDLTSGLSATGGDGSVVDTTANGGSTAFSTTIGTARITVTPVNDVPSFNKGADQTVLEDSGSHTVTNWATNIRPYP